MTPTDSNIFIRTYLRIVTFLQISKMESLNLEMASVINKILITVLCMKQLLHIVPYWRISSYRVSQIRRTWFRIYATNTTCMYWVLLFKVCIFKTMYKMGMVPYGTSTGTGIDWCFSDMHIILAFQPIKYIMMIIYFFKYPHTIVIIINSINFHFTFLLI